MPMSRIERKREAARIFVKRFYAILVSVVVVSILIAAYCWSIFAFTVLSVIAFFGIISLNCFNIRQWIPGIASNYLVIRIGAGIVYLLVVVMIISKVSIYSNK